MKRIGLLGGTFDPFHFGHVNLGLELQEKYGLDEILICPAAASPFKVDQPTGASPEQRLQMSKLAVEDIKSWRVTDWAVKRPAPSYMIDMVLHLYAEAEKNKEKIEVFLLLGQDLLGKLGEWKEVEKLLILAPPLIGIRNSDDIIRDLSPSLKKICQKGVTPTKVLDISSTHLRDRLKKRLYCGHLVPPKTLDFIYHHQLYLH